MGARWIDKWAGGRVRDVQGRRVWVIERRGRTITLDVHSEPDALAELALFSRDPGGYRPRRDTVPDRIQIDADTLDALMRDLVKRDTTEDYRAYTLAYLKKWDRALAAKHGSAYDLRHLKLRDLRAALATWKTAEQKRIVAIKTLTAYLRAEGRLDLVDDPTHDLAVPQAVAEKSRRRKGYAMAHVAKVYAEITDQSIRDVIWLRAYTGMHESEIRRVALGRARLRRVDDPSGIAGTLVFPHKSGTHVLSLAAGSYAAAERLQRAGGIPGRVLIHRALERAARAAGVAKPNPSELRHSFATWAPDHGVEVRPTAAGVPMALVASVLGHRSQATTRKFYTEVDVPPMIALPSLTLYHPEDPAPIGGREEACMRWTFDETRFPTLPHRLKEPDEVHAKGRDRAQRRRAQRSASRRLRER
jgi:integrase